MMDDGMKGKKRERERDDKPDYMLARKPEADMTYVDYVRVNEWNGGLEKQAEGGGKKCPSIKESKAGKDQASGMTRMRVPSSQRNQALCFSVDMMSNHT